MTESKAKCCYDTTSFENGKEMLCSLSNMDLYNEETGEYVFCYNDNGSIAVYLLTSDKASNLKEITEGTDEGWSCHLGPGGSIYDDPSCEGRNEYAMTNEEWCNDHYKGTWRIVKEW